MAWIEQVKFSGLAGNKRTRVVDLNRDMNIFWGDNGCGKTTLLKVLHSALAGTARDLRRSPISNAEVRIQTDEGPIIAKLVQFRRHETSQGVQLVAQNLENELFEIDIDLFSEDELEALSRRSRIHHSWVYFDAKNQRLDGSREFAHRYLTVSRVPSGFSRDMQFRLMNRDRHEPAMEDSDLVDYLFVDGMQEVWREYATQELVDIRKIQQQGLAAILSAVIMRESDGKSKAVSKFSADQASNAVRTFFQAQNISLPSKIRDRLVQEYASDSLLRRVVGEIVEVQKQVDTAQEPTRKIEELIGQMFSGGKQVQLSPKSISIFLQQGKRRLPLGTLSSGEKQLLRLFVECRAAGDGAIIVDEPELSMHVDWQHYLLQHMQTINPDAQIIVATHSPEIQAPIADKNIFEL